MAQEGTNVKDRSRERLKEPEKYDVVFYNDDFTPMDFVTLVLKHIFYKTDIEAEQLMLKVHHEGSAIVGSYSYDIANSKTADATSVARQNGFPLRISVKRG